MTLQRQYLPIEALPAWARLNGIICHGVAFECFQSSDGTDKGSAVIAKEEKYNGDPASEDSRPEILIRVPPDMVLSLELVDSYAKSDRYLREVLDAVGEYGRVRILLFFIPIFELFSCHLFIFMAFLISVDSSRRYLDLPPAPNHLLQPRRQRAAENRGIESLVGIHQVPPRLCASADVLHGRRTLAAVRHVAQRCRRYEDRLPGARV